MAPVSGNPGRNPSWVIIVPGLAVRRYAIPAAEVLRQRGHTVDLLKPPGWWGTPTDVRRYATLLADGIERRADSTDTRVGVLVGLSIGTEAAALAALRTDRVSRLLLVSPTIDPIRRSWPPLLHAWFFGSEGPDGPGLRSHLPDWARAGVLRILLGLRGALRVRLEQLLPTVGAGVTIVHAEHDPLTRAEWAEALAADSRAEYLALPGQPHSWPYGDERHFADLIERMLA